MSTEPETTAESVTAAEPEPVAQPVDESLAQHVEEPAEQLVEQPVQEPAEEPIDQPRPARRPLTLLLVGALLLGPLLGGGVGYAIQASRPPTPLPPLQPAVLPQYPAGALDAKAAAAVAPGPLAIDGDLRKLLLAKPDDAQDWDNFNYGGGDGWESVGDMARSQGNSAKAFPRLLVNGVRRTALATWQKGGVKYRIELIQYFSDSSQGAIGAADFMNQSGVAARSFGGGMEGAYEAPTDARTYYETNEKFYYGYADTRRGDVLVSVEAFSPSQVNADDVKDIAKRQWERLA